MALGLLLAGLAAVLAVSVVQDAPAKQQRSAAGARLFGIVLQGDLSAADVARLRALNPASVRFIVLWDGVQKSGGACTAAGGACDWSSIDPLVGASASAGAAALPFLYGSPAVLGLKANTPPIGPQGAPLWQAFLRAAVGRYGPGGLYWQGPFQAAFPGATPKPVRDWQPWNEPGSPQYFRPKPNVHQLAKLLKISAAAIRGVDRRADVVLPGLFSGGNNPHARGRIPAAPYLRKLYKVKGVERSFDIVALHPYSSDVGGVIDQAESVRDAMKDAGDARTKLWITELGWASNVNKKSLISKGLRGQARILSKAFKALLRLRGKLGLGAVQWFSLDDAPRNQSSCPNCPFTGLIRTDASPKPSFNAFKRLTH